ncbi:hypothetical protein [Herbaspirillum sp. SJZ107]|uniref:FimV/HubP-related protein n=1 Tax=Herbaspirillum sp. SJZ107 TaxID=2572881 RepID=UPI00114ED2D1|nr:hypothetical protein [Herbaspirillum sp. SJZ107]
MTGAALGDAGAAELGDARVSSHIGQQLVADIELVMLDDPAAPVAVRLASPEVYRGAGIALPPVLSNLNLTVMRRDGRQFLHVTSLRPLDAEHLHLYLELTDKGQRAVRLATLWLTPDPNPAPPPSPAPVPAPAPAPAAALAAVQAGVAPTRVPAPLPAPVSTMRPAARPAVASSAAPAAADPSAAPSAPVPAKAALQPPVERRKPLPALPIHKPAALHAAGQPAACTPGEAQACSALGEKNAALREQLATLEDKVKGLQKILGVTPAAAPAAAPVAETHKADAAKTEAARSGEHKVDEHKADEHKAGTPEAGGHKAGEPKAEEHQADGHEPETAPAEAKPAEPKPAPPAGPKPISSIKPLVPHKPKTPPPEEGGAPWGWIGAGIALLAAGGAAAFVLKRRPRGAAAPAADGLLGRLKARLASRGKAASPAAGSPAKVVEPTME